MPSVLFSSQSSADMAATQTESQLLPSLKRSRPAPDDSSKDISTMNKRPKVSFEDQVEVRSSDDLPGKSLALVQAEIRQAIKSHGEAEVEEYDRLKEYFAPVQDDNEGLNPALIRTYLLGMANNANLLSRSCSDLVHAVLGHQWLACDEAFIHIYFHFLRQLVSLQPGYVTEVLKMLVRNFAHLSSSAGALPQHTLMKRLELQARVHTAIRHILRLQPSANTILSGLLQSNFPFRTESKKAHVEYVRNILKVIEYAPELRSGILDLITDKLVTIDVQVQVDVEDFEYDIEETLMQGGYSQATQLDIEYDDDDSDSESIMSEEEEDPEEQQLRELKSSVEKMDAILDLLFAFFHPTFTAGASPDTDLMFSQLLSQFRNIVLPTYRSRHTQFLLFHFAQTSSDLTVRFADSCISAIMDKSYAPVLRTSAAAYLASFAARGAHLSHDDIDYIFRNLSSYLEKLRAEFEPTMTNTLRGSIPSLTRHSAYYATFQALIYIFCFRWRDLLAEPEEHVDEDVVDLVSEGRELDWAPGVREVFQRHVCSQLNPLKLCAPEIVDEFARITHHLRFMYVYQIIDKNRRLRLGRHILAGSSSAGGMAARETGLSAARRGDRMFQLDAYFPFDPYRLPVSKRWLVGDYTEWRGIPGLNDETTTDAEEESSVAAGEQNDDDDDDEEDDDDKMDKDVVAGTTQSVET